MSLRTTRFSVGFTAEEAERLRQHPEFSGSLPELVRALALASVGVEAPDSWAFHRGRDRDEQGRILPPWVALLRAALEVHHKAGQKPVHADLHRELSRARNANRVRQVLTPVLLSAAGHLEARPEAYRDLTEKLDHPEDWEDVRDQTMLASAAAAATRTDIP